jgi:YihY family inner membrane protein
LGELFRRASGAFDRFQRRHRVTAVFFAMTKRYGEDRGGQLAALVTFYGFLSVFPLLLLLLTFAGLFLHGSHLENTIVNSALAQFPVIGVKLRSNLHALAKGNIAAAIVSTLGLIWGSLGVTSSLQNATHHIWRLPANAARGLWPRTLKGLQLLGALGFIVVLSSIAAAMSTVGQQFFGGGGIFYRLLILLAALTANFAGYLLVLWLLSPDGTTVRTLLPGTAFGAVGWTILQALSGYLLGHQLHHASQIYGFFAVVLGLVFWINLGAQLFLYSSELNLVLANRQWPRYLFSEEPPEERSR